MENYTINDGLILTVVSMLVVFILLAAIWGLVELTSWLIAHFTPTKIETETPASAVPTDSAAPLVANPQHKKVAEIMALVLASEDQPNKKLEITHSKRVK